MALSISQWLNMIGIGLEMISLLAIIFSMSTEDEAIEQKVDELFAGLWFAPSRLETREGQIRIAIPLMFGLIFQIIATVIA
jgi:hypothetical protein